MALPPSFLDELRARTPLAPLIGRRVKLTRSSRDWKGCCPFHGEKSPSFYVYTDHYHCFGCGVHGDAISFVMQTQNAGFMEAVEQLAAEAGMDVPRPSPEAAAAEKQRADLNEILAAAGRFFEDQLAGPNGREARDYLDRRGLSAETIRRFGLGFSGPGRGALAAEFARAGIEMNRLVEAGLMKQTEDGRMVDFFFNRVMFPIRDARGRPISFGGRIMGDGQPKYLNGPETALFSKRRTLYGLDLARADLANTRRQGQRQSLLVVEGYMDVIALSQGGFPAVAPLGTAITPEQVEAIWQYHDRPVFCFDGDAAGRRAGRKAIDLTLPLLTPDHGLGIAILPQGEDPDSIVTKRGRQGMADALARDDLTIAIYELIKDEIQPSNADSWAKFRDKLDEAANAIAQKTISGTYWGVLRDRWKDDWFTFRSGDRKRSQQPWAPNRNFTPGGRRGDWKNTPPPVAIPPRPVIQTDVQTAERARVLLAILLTHPALLPDLEEPLGMLDLPPHLTRLRDALAAWLDGHPELDREALNAHLRRLGYDGDVSVVLEAKHLPASAMPNASLTEAASSWWQIYGFMRQAQLEEEVAAKQRQFSQTQDAETARQLVALTEALQRLRSGDMDSIQ
ncbi:DNA primase [Acidisoma cellulosilytica]|uniref:DNA primase n=1 Tax=Acidisoma cellulosilyticum TaxID=2802395 RepID=A0A963Z0H9_9PROT|nr:DNA primase [Acidisoma cellulosilyticum]MCB8880450.1 DNA primase [Acidisoma cellulosilyticum]